MAYVVYAFQSSIAPGFWNCFQVVCFSSEKSGTDSWKDTGCWTGATKLQVSSVQAADGYRNQLLKGQVEPCQGKVRCCLHAS